MSSEETICRPKREGKPTEKGDEYKQKIREENLKKEISKWRRQACLAKEEVEDVTDFNRELVKQHRRSVKEQFDKVTTAYGVILTSLPAEEKKNLTDMYEDLEKKHFDL